jgi:hypothetical protein
VELSREQVALLALLALLLGITILLIISWSSPGVMPWLGGGGSPTGAQSGSLSTVSCSTSTSVTVEGNGQVYTFTSSFSSSCSR